MRKKITVIALSLLLAFMLMSSGYGLWRDKLTITGNIEIRQDPEVLTAIRNDLERQIFEYQRQQAEKIQNATEVPAESPSDTEESMDNEIEPLIPVNDGNDTEEPATEEFGNDMPYSKGDNNNIDSTTDSHKDKGDFDENDDNKEQDIIDEDEKPDDDTNSSI